MRRSAELHRKRPERAPIPGRIDERQRHVGDGRNPDQEPVEANWMFAGPGSKSAETVEHARGHREQHSRDPIGDQELPQEPFRSARPERQRKPLVPEPGEARLRGAGEIGGIERERAQENDGCNERYADAPEPVGNIGPGALAAQAARRQQARQKEHQRHQADVLPGTEHVEAHPALRIDHWKGLPSERRLAERRGLRRHRGQVGERGVERQYDNNHNGPEIIEGDVGFGHDDAVSPTGSPRRQRRN